MKQTVTIFLLLYLIAVNLIAFFAMRRDKRAAKAGALRTPEKTLFLLAILGGSLGAMLGMKVFHHKTKHKSFTIGMPLIFALQLALAVWLILPRI